MKNIYLVGFMGTGKTVAGKLLAKQLKVEFLDMDELIEEREKTPISEIFKAKGEPYFRQLEKDIVAELAKRQDLVVACGGGTFVADENIKNLKMSGTVFCLISTPEQILKRTSKFAHRPLLNVLDPRAKIEELLKKREPYYANAHFMIDGDQLTVEEMVEEILKKLNPALP